MRIGVDARTLHWPGIGRFTRELLASVARLDSSHEYVVYVGEGEQLGIGAPNIRTIPLPRHVALAPLSLAWRMSRDRLDVAYAPTTMIAPLAAPCPLVATLHDFMYDRFPQFLRSRSKRLYYTMTHGRVLRRAAHIVTISDATRRDLAELHPARHSRSSTIHNGVSERWRVIENRARLEAGLAKLGLDPGFIMYVGTYKEHKNVPALVRAYAQLPEHLRRRHLLVLVARRDERFPEAPRLVESLDLREHVQFIDWVDDEGLLLLYNGADLFVTPSLHEGFCLPLVEAIACGTPAACSNISAMPEVAGEAAVLFDPRSDAAIAAALEQALTDEPLRAALRERGLARATMFSWSVAAEQYLEHFERFGRAGRDVRANGSAHRAKLAAGACQASTTSESEL